MNLLSRRLGRTLAATTVLALAASTGVALAPSAFAYYGTSTTVKNAVLTATQIANAGAWSNGYTDSHGVYANNSYDWENDIDPAGVIASEVAPLSAELTVGTTSASRDAYYADNADNLSGESDAPVVTTSNSVTVDLYVAPSGTDSGGYYAYTEHKTGSDGVAVGVCGATTDTTTTATQRYACSQAVASAQAAKWAAISPNVVFKSTSSIKAKLLTGKQAHSAVKLTSKGSVHVIGTGTGTQPEGGRDVSRAFYTTPTTSTALRKLRITTPYTLVVTQYGNRLNATVALAALEKADKAHRTLHDVSSSSYSELVTVTAGGKKTTVAVTATRYADAIVVGSCEANPYKKPSASAQITCARRLTAAQVSKVESLFKSIH